MSRQRARTGGRLANDAIEFFREFFVTHLVPIDELFEARAKADKKLQRLFGNTADDLLQFFKNYDSIFEIYGTRIALRKEARSQPPEFAERASSADRNRGALAPAPARELDELRADLVSANDRIRQRDAEIKQKDAELDEIRRRMAVLDRDRDRTVHLQRQYVGMATEINVIRADRDNSQKKINDLQNLLADAESRLRSANFNQNSENSREFVEEIQRLRLDLQFAKFESEKFQKLFNAETKRRQTAESLAAGSARSGTAESLAAGSAGPSKAKCPECAKKDEDYLQLRAEYQNLMANRCPIESDAEDGESVNSFGNSFASVKSGESGEGSRTIPEAQPGPHFSREMTNDYEEKLKQMDGQLAAEREANRALIEELRLRNLDFQQQKIAEQKLLAKIEQLRSMKNPDRDPNRDRDPNPPQPSERIMQIVHEKDRLKGQLAIKNEEIENLKENFQKSANGLTDEANSLRRNLEQAQAAHNSLEAELNRVRLDEGQLKLENNQLIESNRRQRALFQQQIQQLQQQIQQPQQQIQQLQQRIQQLQQQICALEAEKLQKDLNIEQLQKRNNRFQIDLQNAVQQAEQLEVQLQNFPPPNSAENVDAILAEKNDLRTNFQAAKVSAEYWEKEATDAQRDLNRISNEYEAFKQQHATCDLSNRLRKQKKANGVGGGSTAQSSSMPQSSSAAQSSGVARSSSAAESAGMSQSSSAATLPGRSSTPMLPATASAPQIFTAASTSSFGAIPMAQMAPRAEPMAQTVSKAEQYIPAAVPNPRTAEVPPAPSGFFCQVCQFQLKNDSEWRNHWVGQNHQRREVAYETTVPVLGGRKLGKKK